MIAFSFKVDSKNVVEVKNYNFVDFCKIKVCWLNGINNAKDFIQ